MKVILAKNINNLGLEGEEKNISDGYARNYLIPSKLAVEATKETRAQWERKRKAIEERAALEKAAKLELAKKLSEASYAIKVEAGETGKIFGSVTSADIAHVIRSVSGVEVDKKDIDLPENINGLGQHEVRIKLHPEVETKVKIEIEAK